MCLAKKSFSHTRFQVSSLFDVFSLRRADGGMHVGLAMMIARNNQLLSLSAKLASPGSENLFNSHCGTASSGAIFADFNFAPTFDKSKRQFVDTKIS